MSPFHGLSFGFRLVVMTPRLISGDDAIQKFVTFSFVVVQQVPTHCHSLRFVIFCKHSGHPSRTDFAITKMFQHFFQGITADIQLCTQFAGLYPTITTDELIKTLFIAKSTEVTAADCSALIISRRGE